MRNASLTIWVMAVFVVAICFGLPTADADIYFDDGGYHTVNYLIDDSINVDYGMPGVGTSVEIVQGGRVTQDIWAFEDSRVLINGGDIGTALENGIFAEGNSEVTFAAGVLRAPLYSIDYADVLISGGDIQYYVAPDGYSSVTITGGTIAQDLQTMGNSLAVVSGGAIQGYVMARFNSQITISGGSFGSGFLAGVYNEPGSALITFEGIDFAVDGTSIGYGEMASDFASPDIVWGHPCLTGTLTGTLADGGTLNKTFYIFDDADITFAMPEPAIIYVDADAGGANNGSSWTDAYRYLQNGLAVAWSGDEIRVAKGIYKPDRGGGNALGDRRATFQLKNGVALRGGYAGFGEPDPNVRDIDLYETILSGDLLGNDGQDFANNYENSCHVVTSSGTNATAVLDGFTITAGNANCSWPDGGGMFNEWSSQVVTNCTFSGNSANRDGGGMYNSDSSPTMNGCAFTGNSANFGGGIFCGWSSPTITNCIFLGNSAREDGGGISIGRSYPILTHCTFSGNSAARDGGGMHIYGGRQTLTNCTFSGNSGVAGGGMVNTRNEPTLSNCKFIANSAADYGGGMVNMASNLTLTNCTFAANSAPAGNALACDYFLREQVKSNVQVTNCILWDGGDEIRNYDGSTVTITYSDVQGSWAGTGNINANPLFVDPAIGDYHLLPDSPCIDAGDNTAVPADTADLDGDGDTTEKIPFDLDGNL